MKQKCYLCRLWCPFTYTSSNPPLLHYVVGLLSNRVVGRVTSNHVVGRVTSNIGHVISNPIIGHLTSNRVVECVTPNCVIGHVTPLCVVGCISSVPHRFKCTPRSNCVPQAFWCIVFDLPFYRLGIGWIATTWYGKGRVSSHTEKFSLQSWLSHATSQQGTQDVWRDVRCQ